MYTYHVYGIYIGIGEEFDLVVSVDYPVKDEASYEELKHVVRKEMSMSINPAQPTSLGYVRIKSLTLIHTEERKD